MLLLLGVALGVFAAPNRAGIMNSLPPDRRGAGSGVVNTFQNSAQVLSIGIFFTLIIAGLSTSLPGRLFHGLTAQGVPAATARSVSHLPPVASLFAAFLGYDPMQKLLGPTLHALPAHTVGYLTGRSFFPQLISHSFAAGLHDAFWFAAAMCVLAAAASWLRGGKYLHSAAVAATWSAAPAVPDQVMPVPAQVPAKVVAMEAVAPVPEHDRPAERRAAGAGGGG